MKRNIPYSLKKYQIETKMKYIKVILREKKGQRIDNEAKQKRQQYLNMNFNDNIMEVLKESLNEVKNDWSKFQRLLKIKKKKL